METTLQARSGGRAYFWAGIGLTVLGLALCIVQYRLHHTEIPWYSPVLATLGALLLLVAVLKRLSIGRIVVFGLIGALAAFQWLFLVSLSRLPAYEGPARAGQKLPEFQTSLADGTPFTATALEDGKRTVMVFFRGRW